MNILITGGAGFIGRWTVKKFLDNGHSVTSLDNLSNSTTRNIEEFNENKNFKFILGDILDENILDKIFNAKIDICVHLAAMINVHESLENPRKHFEVNVVGTQNLLERCHKGNIKFLLLSTCMVYDTGTLHAINEEHPLKPTSPYAGSKAAAEYLALSYHYSFKLPVAVLRPFNTYGPYQKSNGEGGVVSIFQNKKLKGEKLEVFGDGSQTRDLLYVEDCANFIYQAALNERSIGQIINAGYGEDIAIKELAYKIAADKSRVEFVKHHHPQSEISKLKCDVSKAKRLLNWEPMVALDEGMKKTEEWIKSNSKL